MISPLALVLSGVEVTSRPWRADPLRAVPFAAVIGRERRRRRTASRSPRPRAHPPSWAAWNRSLGQPYSIGVEEELMLLRRADHLPAQASDEVLKRLSKTVAEHATPETHAAVIELATGVHDDVDEAAGELASLRAQLALDLGGLGLCAFSSGTYPLEGSAEVRLSARKRYQSLGDSLRMLARRDPTMALHVHVGIPDPEDAIRVLNGIGNIAPILLAASANSPFCGGRDSGFASARTVIFGAFPRTGTARHFADYSDYVTAVDALIAAGALPDPSYLWWDVRLQPTLGTVEVRVMDAQSSVADSAPLVALVRSLAAFILSERPPGPAVPREILAENRFLAARDGMRARIINPATGALTPVRTLLRELLDRCAPHAAALDCSGELEQIHRLARANGAMRQRAHAEQAGLTGLIARLAEEFATVTSREEESYGDRLRRYVPPTRVSLVPSGLGSGRTT